MTIDPGPCIGETDKGKVDSDLVKRLRDAEERLPSIYGNQEMRRLIEEVCQALSFPRQNAQEIDDKDLAIAGLHKDWNKLLNALERIAVVCTDNMGRDCKHRMALDFVRQIATDALAVSPHEGQEK